MLQVWMHRYMAWKMPHQPESTIEDKKTGGDISPEKRHGDT